MISDIAISISEHDIFYGITDFLEVEILMIRDKNALLRLEWGSSGSSADLALTRPLDRSDPGLGRVAKANGFYLHAGVSCEEHRREL